MNITVTKRAAQTKGERRKRMRQGFIPGAIYGRGLEPMAIEVPARGIADVLLTETGLNTIIELAVEGDSSKHTVLIDNLERDRITRGFRSVGFHQVKKGDKVTAQIPIQLVGTPAAVASNEALMDQLLETITVHAEPRHLPAHLDVDVSKLNVGDVLRVADLPHNPKVEFTQAEDVAIAAVHYSTTAQTVEETAPEAEETPALSGEDAVTELRADADSRTDSVTGTASP